MTYVAGHDDTEFYPKSCIAISEYLKSLLEVRITILRHIELSSSILFLECNFLVGFVCANNLYRFKISIRSLRINEIDNFV